MTVQSNSPNNSSSNEERGTFSFDPVNNPINIARARHASAYNPSIVDEPYQATAPDVKRQTEQPKTLPNNLGSEMSGCLLIALLGITFVVGAVFGGIIGGELILLVNGRDGVALWQNAPTVTPTILPSPVSVATLSPTATREPIATPLIEEIIDQVTKSVVTVINKHDSRYLYKADEGRVVGSGVVIDARGYIATNNHVIENPGRLSVVLSDGREVEAELIAARADRDLAVLKINLINLPIIQWGDSTKLRAGQPVYALGSPLGDFPNSVSYGIISGLNRALEMDKFVIDGLIQTDAAINRGSSGGPLINPSGQMVGLNTFIIRESEERGIAEGIAFAIPAETAKAILLPWIAAHSASAEAIPVVSGQ